MRRRRRAAAACQLGCSASCGTLYSLYSLAVAFGWPLPPSALGSGEARCVSEAVSCEGARGGESGGAGAGVGASGALALRL